MGPRSPYMESMSFRRDIELQYPCRHLSPSLVGSQALAWRPGELSQFYWLKLWLRELKTSYVPKVSLQERGLPLRMQPLAPFYLHGAAGKESVEDVHPDDFLRLRRGSVQSSQNCFQGD